MNEFLKELRKFIAYLAFIEVDFITPSHRTLFSKLEREREEEEELPPYLNTQKSFFLSETFRNQANPKEEEKMDDRLIFLHHPRN